MHSGLWIFPPECDWSEGLDADVSFFVVDMSTAEIFRCVRPRRHGRRRPRPGCRAAGIGGMALGTGVAVAARRVRFPQGRLAV
jgi:hypothetical protein